MLDEGQLKKSLPVELLEGCFKSPALAELSKENKSTSSPFC